MDIIAELERIDRFFDGKEKGVRPIDVIRSRGIEIPPENTLGDAATHARLWEVLEAMGEIGMVLYFTDHLSDRDLYRYLVEDVLLEETILSEEGGFWHISPIGGCSDEDNQIYLRYYADEETREQWGRDFEMTVPAKEPLPYDRDRFLPGRS